MASTASVSRFDAESFEQFLAVRHEPEWLVAQRRAAWEHFQATGWPERSSEDWMRSDLRAFKLDNYVLPVEPAAIAPTVPVWLTEGVELGGRLEVLDGVQSRSEVASKWTEKGVVFGSLDESIATHGDLIRNHLFKLGNATDDRFAALHAATWTGGSFLYVPRNVTVDQPFHVLSGLSNGGTDLAHSLIVLEEGAEATVLAESNSVDPEANGFHCGGLEIVLKPGARLRYVNLQDWGRGTWHFSQQRASVDRDASLQWTIAAMGSRFAQVSQQVALVGKGAESQVNGVMFTQQRQQLTFNTVQHHKAAHCRSDFLYKSALQDRSRTVWRGMIKVDQTAQKTDGYQRNDNLLLSDQCRADSIPGLEILADDVRCTHGSTTGKVDEELIFYARSRGFTRKEAIRMIVTGFFQQIFDRVTIESVRDALGLAIARQVREYR